MAINFPNDPATNPGDGGQWTDSDGNLWQVEIISGEAVWTMIQAAGTDDGGGSGAVDSVNGQTGDVSLGIQDMDDYYTPSSGYVFDTYISPASPNEPGQWSLQQPGIGANNLAFAKEDANGATTSPIKDLPIGSSIWLNGVEFTTKGAGGSYSGAGTVGSWFIPIDEDLSTLDTSGGLTISTEAAITDGDILQWVEAAQKFKPTQPGDGTPLDDLLTVDGDAVKYDTAPTLGTDATDVVIPTMGQVRAAIASNGGTSVSLNDLSDVNYTQKGTDDSWTLEPINLDEILFQGQDTPNGTTRKLYTNTLYGMALASYTATNSGSYIFAHETKGIILRSPGDNGVLWIEGQSATNTSQPEIRISNGNAHEQTPTGNYIGFKMPAGVAADVTWTLPAVDGAASSVLTSDGAGNLTFEPLPQVTIPTTTYEINYEGLTAYKFTGPGLDGTELNPSIYVVRGQKYIFSNVLGAHPFQLQTVAGTGESPYTDGVTGDQPIDLGSFEWEVPMDAPSTLYYQCTVHTAMSGVIYVLDNSGGGGAGAVESVNSQTGVVSLGIQDMDDFGLNLLGGSTWDDDGSEGASPTSAGSWSSLDNRFSRYAADGSDLGTELDALAVDSDIWYGAPGETLIQGTVATVRTDFSATGAQGSNVGYREFTITGISFSSYSGSGIVLAFSDPATSVAPLADGDILQWNDTDQKFKPAALASVATSGDYNDLINAPSAGDAPVTSVNTETGDVSLGIQDMDDFELANASDPAYQYYSVYSFTSGTLSPSFYNEPGKCLAYESGRTIYCNSDGASDSSGSDLQPDFQGSSSGAAGAGWVTLTTVTFWLRKENEPWTQHTGTYQENETYFILSNILPTFQQCDGINNTVLGTSLYISAFDPGTTPKKPLANEDILQWDSVAESFVPAKLDYSQINNTPAVKARITPSITTAALAIDATETGEITGTGATGFLISAQTDTAAWVRLYCSPDAMTADASRDIDTDPAPGAGVLFESLYSNFTEKPITPGTTYFNLSGLDKLYYRITNKSAIDNTSIKVTLKLLPME